MSGQKYCHMTPVLHHKGLAGQQWLENEKAPFVSGGAQKIRVHGIPRTRKPLVHPLKVDSINTAHHITCRPFD
jgi:hypothetical protein